MSTKKKPDVGASLNDWLAYLESIHPKTMDLGLDRVIQVYRKLLPKGLPSQVIIVGGTNGKGSTVAALDWLLRQQGKRTAAYTSPHLHRYNERVRLSGEEVDDRVLIEAFEAVEAARGRTSLTYFEFGTLAALWVFFRAAPDVVILEVGLGGRLDAVNVVDPDVAVITSVDIDHADWLGTDRETIGYEKAGILRARRPAVYGESTPPDSVLQQANAQKVDLYVRGRDFGPQPEGGEAFRVGIRYRGEELTLEIPESSIPRDSVVTALQALALLDFDPLALDVTGLCRELRIPGRFETLSESPRILVDVGHNPHAARWLRERLANSRNLQPVTAVYGCLSDKDCVGVVQALAAEISHWYLAGLDVPRGLSAEALSLRLAEAGLRIPVTAATQSVSEALDQAVAALEPGGTVLVFGSFFTVAEAREHLERAE